MADQLDQLMTKVAEFAADNQKLPPVDSWHPPFSGDIDIHIDGSGRWFHEGAAFQREALVKVFASILRREGGDYFLVTPVEKWRIRVDDVPFVVSAMDVLTVAGEQVLVFRTSVGDRVIAGPDHPLRVAVQPGGDIRPYLLVRGGMEGLLTRPVYYQLADHLQPGPDKEKAVQGVYSLGAFFPLA